MDLDICRERRSVVERTLEFFGVLGFEAIAPEPAVPTRDDSILFTNSAVVCFKPYLRREREADPGVVVAQDCLRWQNLSDLSEQSLLQHRLNHFLMLGAFSKASRGHDFARETLALLVDVLRVPQRRLLLKLPSKDGPLVDAWQSLPGGPELAFDSEPAAYYDWVFGMEGVSGVGGTFSYRLSRGGTYHDFGNVISFYGGSDLLGLGLGFGVESFLYALLGLTHFACALPTSANTDVRDPRVGRLVDLLETAVLLYRDGLRPGRSGHGYVVKRVARGIGRLSGELGFARSELSRLIDRFEEGEYGGSSGVAEVILADCDRYAPGSAHHELVRRDVSLLCPSAIEPDALASHVRREFGDRLAAVDVFDVYDGPAIPEHQRSVGLALRFHGRNGASDGEDIGTLVDEILRGLCRQFPVALREVHARSRP